MDEMKIAVVGDANLLAAFQAMSKASQRRVLRPAVRAGAAIVRDEARRQLDQLGAKQTGELRRKTTNVVRTYGRGDRAYVVGVIGSKVADAVSKRAGRGRKARTVQRRASRYAHLVEGGTQRTKPRPYLERASAKTRARQIEEFRRLVAREIPKEWAKIAQRKAKAAARRAGGAL